MPPDYTIEKYYTDLFATLNIVIRENKLGLFFDNCHLAKYIPMLREVMDYHKNVRKIFLKLDKETLLEMYTVDSEVLKKELCEWVKRTRYADRYDGQHIVVKITLTPTDREELCLEAIALDESVKEKRHVTIFSKIIKQGKSIAGIAQFIEEYEALLIQTKQEMNDFLRFSVLRKHYKNDYLREQKKSILEWIATTIKKGWLFRLDATNNNLYEQLFTCWERQKTPEELLTACIDYEPLRKNAESNGLYKKKNMLLGVQRLSCDEKVLTEQLKPSANCFLTNRDEYAELYKRGKNNAMKVDVFKVCVDDDNDSSIVCCLTILEEAYYSMIAKSLKDATALNSNLAELVDESRIIAYSQKSYNSKLYQAYIDDVMKDMSNSFTLPRGEIETDFNRFLGKRVIILGGPEYGIDASTRMVKGLIDRSVLDSNNSIERLGGVEAFPDGRVAVTRSKIPLNQINETTLPLRLQCKETPLLIRDHQQAKADINTLNCKIGDSWLSQHIIPCVMNHHQYYVREMTINNNTTNTTTNNYGTINVLQPYQQQQQLALKRKRGPNKKPSKDQSKKCRLVTPNENDLSEEDREDDPLPVVVLETKRVIEPDYAEKRKCPVCDTRRQLKSFCQGKKYIYVSNVCNSCRTRKSSANKHIVTSQEIEIL